MFGRLSNTTRVFRRADALKRCGLTSTGLRTGIVLDSGPKGDFRVEVFERITVNPKQCGGRPCIRGMRIRVSDVLELLADGMTGDQILDEHPDLEIEDIQACLRSPAST
jgi:uncharacterized protein (DUF433 family)